MPEEIFDAHVHLGPPEVMGEIGPQRERVPLCTFTNLRLAQMRGWQAQLFPRKHVPGFIAFPFPLREVDIAAANRYLIDVMRAAPEVRGFLLAHPTDLTPTLAAWEAALAAGVRFCGVKPYFDLLRKSVFECSMAEFIPDSLLRFMDDQQLVLMLHTSGNGMGDLSNQQYVRGVLERFPGIKIVLAHMGRYLQADEFFRFADSGLLDYPELYLEMSSATLPAVYARALQYRPIHRRLLFGTDLPFGLITGIEAWSERAGAIFVTRDTYPWTDQATQQASPVRPEQLTYNTYHVLRAFKTALDALGLPSAEEAAIKQAVFRKNAESLFAAEAPCVSKNTLSTALALPGLSGSGPNQDPRKPCP
jgi:predicted TIM-barrel fold metal-dependent hydrolase